MSDPEKRGICREELSNFVKSLPYLSADDLPDEESCPICLNTFVQILKGRNITELEPAQTAPSDAGEEHVGVTKLPGCGHIFCRMDIVEWVDSYHGSCPTCRNVFLHLPPVEDYESSDGGEYVPPDEEDDDDYYMSEMDEVDELHTSDIDEDEDAGRPEGHNTSPTSANITWLSYDEDGDADVEDWPPDDAEDSFMTDFEGSGGALTDGGDTLSSEGEPVDIGHEDTDIDSYAADVSMTSGDDDDDVLWTDFESKSDAPLEEDAENNDP